MYLSAQHEYESYMKLTNRCLRCTNHNSRCVCVYFQEAQLARSEAERMASLAGSHSHASLLSLDAPMEDIPEDERPPSILSPSNTTKDRCRKTLRNLLIAFKSTKSSSLPR